MLTHVDSGGRPSMVDVGDKAVTLRRAHARATVRLPPGLVSVDSAGEIMSAKGPVFSTAIVAGTMAAKRTHELIPFCHPLGIEGCKFGIAMGEDGVILIDCRVKVHHRTGVEMEALTGATVAALTVYDMCKALSHDISIEEVRLVSKHGGKRDFGGENDSRA